MSDITVRDVVAGDLAAWEPLFAGYRHFYHREDEPTVHRAIWGWLMDETHPLRGLVAEDETGALLGLAHWHRWSSTLSGTEVCYLSDLFVDPAARGRAVGRRLFEELLEVCRGEGLPVLTLLTQEGNASARALYDQYGAATDFILYAVPVTNS